MLTLALETSTPRGSVAVIADGSLLFSESVVAERGHSAELFVSLDRALKIAPRCDRIVVGLGPGSYSGVRVAIAAAIGLEFGLHSRLVGIPSVAAIETDAPVYQAVGDARRGSFFYARISDGECLEGPLLLPAVELREKLGTNETLAAFSSAPIEGFPMLQIAFPSAENLARLAERERGVCARDRLEPIYLREPHITKPNLI
jgi:tRNA threonylcarbamoyladenosine biosynthesis protein TsaB